MISYTNYFNLCTNKYNLRQAFLRDENSRIRSIWFVNCRQIFVKLASAVLNFLRIVFSKIAQNSQNIWATFLKRMLPNLITLQAFILSKFLNTLST